MTTGRDEACFKSERFRDEHTTRKALLRQPAPDVMRTLSPLSLTRMSGRAHDMGRSSDRGKWLAPGPRGARIQSPTASVSRWRHGSSTDAGFLRSRAAIRVLRCELGT